MAFLLVLLPSLAATQETNVLVDEFDPAPDGAGGSDGQFDYFMQRVVPNDSGVVVFRAFLNNGQQGIFRTDGVATVQVARQDNVAPDSNGNPVGVFSGFVQNSQSINDAGDVAILAEVQESDGSFRRGIWRFDGTALIQVTREGDPAPDGDGVITSLSAISQINDTGAVAFSVRIIDASGQSEDAILLSTGSELITVAREGDLVQGAEGPVFTAIGTSDPGPLLNDLGHVAFIAADDNPNTFENTALYVWDGTSLSVVVSEGSGAPGGGEFWLLSDIRNFTNSGEIAWRSRLRNSTSAWGVFRGNTREVVAIARMGDPAPSSSGGNDGVLDYQTTTDGVLVNDDGEVLFKAIVSATASGTDTVGLFRGDGDELSAIIRAGDNSPDGDGQVVTTGQYSLNKWGHVVFVAHLTNTAGGTADDYGIFLYDDAAGFLKVAREGDPIGIGFRGGIGTALGIYPDRDGFNDSSQVAFYYSPPNHRNAIALFDPGDIFPPTISQVRTNPPSPESGDTVALLANIDDTATGNANILSAEFRFDGGEWQSMLASDGVFDAPAEDVEADINVALSSEHELCVRGTDALGWTSGPECISIVVGEKTVGLRVRCLHSPLYPQDGDSLAVTAQALDRDGVPVVVDAVEIYINDRDAPVLTEPGTDSEVTATLNVIGEEMFYGCRALRGSEDAFSRYVTVDVGEPNDPNFPAIAVLNHGEMAEKIDLVFFPELDSYPEGPLSEDFLNNLHQVIREGLFEIPWFVRWQYVLNIWIATEGADVIPRALPDGSPLCAADKPPGYARKYSFGDAIGIIHQENCRDAAIPLWPFTTQFDENDLQVVAHEIGHKAFSLADEYVTSPTVRFSTPPKPNLFPTLVSCRFAAEERGKNPDDCRELPGSLNFNGKFIFEPDYRNDEDPTSEVRDLMQQTGSGACSFDDSETCARYRVGDSEEARVFWKLSKCISGEC